MKYTLSILFIILILWLILYFILEFSIVNKKIKIVKQLFQELDLIFIKRLNVLYKILDIIKEYDKIEFDVLSSNLYDYINEYNEYNLEKKVSVNEGLNLELKKIFLTSKVYPELLGNSRYVKLEKQLKRYNKVISKLCKKYNNALLIYMDRKKIFPSNLICSILEKDEYKFFSIEN